MVPFVSPQYFLKTFLVHFVDIIVHSLFMCEVTVAGSIVQIYGGTVHFLSKNEFSDLILRNLMGESILVYGKYKSRIY